MDIGQSRSPKPVSEPCCAWVLNYRYFGVCLIVMHHSDRDARNMPFRQLLFDEVLEVAVKWRVSATSQWDLFGRRSK